MNLELIGWFREHNKDKPDKLSHSKTWQIMKENLKQMGYWKNKTRGKHNINYLTKTTGESTTINANKMYIPNE